MSSLAQLRQELAARQDDRNVCDEMLALDPDSTDALETIPVLDAEIADLKAQIVAKEAETNAAPSPPPPPPTHDGSKASTTHVGSVDIVPPPPPPPSDEMQVFNVKDTVMAKWSEDKQWYQGTIVSKTGSSADPVYKVTFKGYGNTETKRKHEVRAFHENPKKRKADGIPSANTPLQQNVPAAPIPQSGSVISAAPSVDTTLVKKREPSKVSDGPTRLAPEPKKLKGSKVLDKAKSSWQDFQRTGPNKKSASYGGPKLGKDSQFRTPDLPNAKGKLPIALTMPLCLIPFKVCMS